MPRLNRLYFMFRNMFAAKLPKLYQFCENRKSVLKFFIAGSFAGVTDLIFLYLFHGIFHWPIVLSTSLAFLASFAVSFTLQKLWTFRNFSQKQVFRQFVLYIGNAFIALNMNGFLMHMTVNQWHIWYLLAQMAVNLALGFYNFVIYKFIIFRHSEDTRQEEIVRTSTGDLA